MAVGEPLGEVLRREPLSVVLHDKHQLTADPGQAHADTRSVGVLDDIGKKLARGSEEQLLLRGGGSAVAGWATAWTT